MGGCDKNSSRIIVSQMADVLALWGGLEIQMGLWKMKARGTVRDVRVSVGQVSPSARTGIALATPLHLFDSIENNFCVMWIYKITKHE